MMHQNVSTDELISMVKATRERLEVASRELAVLVAELRRRLVATGGGSE